MIDIIRTYYNKRFDTDIELEDVRFFDDNQTNVLEAQAQGVMAHHVPAPGLTRKWWMKECKKIEACDVYTE